MQHKAPRRAAGPGEGGDGHRDEALVFDGPQLWAECPTARCPPAEYRPDLVPQVQVWHGFERDLRRGWEQPQMKTLSHELWKGICPSCLEGRSCCLSFRWEPRPYPWHSPYGVAVRPRLGMSSLAEFPPRCTCAVLLLALRVPCLFLKMETTTATHPFSIFCSPG